jgi:methylated-DNA-protein-cysteine methyltransferase-like protein
VAKSPAFARIKADVLRIVAAIPPGRVATFRDIGAHLDAMPRHVAYILATLGHAEQAAIPWHRAIGGDLTLGTPKANGFGIGQAALLGEEGTGFDARGRLLDPGRVVAVADLPHGVARQQRPTVTPGRR